MTRGRRWIAIGAILLIVLLSVLDHAGVFGYRGNDRLRYHHAVAGVVSIAEDCTLDLAISDAGDSTTAVRLLGLLIDDPPRARGTLHELVQGRSVRIILDPNHPTRDRSGHLLAYVYDASSGCMVNEELIRRGAAHGDATAASVMAHRFAELNPRRRNAPPASRD